ncbi:MAG: Wzz/FepE/Etk N-terminal domain-containing protein [Algoriphagus sp.]|nr:Wzz/FepE/Etk N-terminal domain-containing protein [Algoriphagus sp.]
MKKNSKDIFNKKDINLKELFDYFFERKKIFYWSILIMVVLGSIRFFTTPKTYESVATKLTEVESGSQSGLSQLSNLASLSGINLPLAGPNSSISPEMYPEIISSKPFLIELVNEKFYFQTKKDTLVLKDYLVEEYSNRPFNLIFGGITSIPSRFISMFSDEVTVSPIVESALEEEGRPKYLIFSSEEDLASELLKGALKIEDEGTMITLSVKMPEALIAAELNNIIFEKIVRYVTDYKTRKLRINLTFIEERTKESEINFIQSQLALASFRDNNQGMVSQRARTREEQLQAEFNIAYNVYNSMMQELETSRIQLKKETPIFSEFAAPIVPNNPVNTSFLKTFIIFSFLGILVGFGIVTFQMIKEYFSTELIQKEK